MTPRDRYVERTYRALQDTGALATFQVREAESDLWIASKRDGSRAAREALLAVRGEIQDYIKARPRFAESLEPVEPDGAAPEIIQWMIAAGRAAGVGPMAAVAGAVAEGVGRALLADGAEEVIVENWGDLFLASRAPRTVAIFAGASPLSMRVGLRIAAEATPLGVSTSSGTVGPSLSQGRADAAVAVAADACLADAAATALGNRVESADDLDAALAFARGIDGLAGALIIMGEKLGAWGGLEIVRL